MTKFQLNQLLNGAITAPLPNAQSFPGAGDSGGPLLAGASLALPPGGAFPGGLAPSPFPGLAVPYAILGIVSAPASSLASPANSSPESIFSPVYTEDVSKFLAQKLMDSDGDGLPDLADPCPLNGNPGDNLDLDQDLLGDACPGGWPKDPCPCSVIDDADLDGVCDFPNGFFLNTFSEQYEASCLTSAAIEGFDNCSTVINTDQNNCNFLAEKGNDALFMGDKCDPAPCPGIRPTFTKKPITEQVTIGTFPITITSFMAKYDLHRIELRPLGTRNYPVNPVGTVPQLDTAVNVPTTDYRFCFPNAGELFNYRCDEPDGYKDALLGPAAPLRGNEPLPDGQNRWRRIWVHDPALVNGSADLSDAPVQGSWVYRNNQVYPRFWEWSSDFAAWQSSSWFGLIQGSPGQAGVIGAHGETSVGQITLPISSTLLYHHPKLNNLLEAADNLVNAGSPVASSSYTRLNWSLFNALQIPIKPIWFGASNGSDLGGAVLDREGGVYRARDAEPVVAIPGRPDVVGLLEPDGNLREVNAHLGSALREALAAGVEFLTPAEPSPHLGRSLQEPLSVAISADRTSLVDEVRLHQGALLSSQDRGIPPRGARFHAASTGSPPGFPVYSRSRGLVWVVGAILSNGQRGIRWTSTTGEGGFKELETPGLVLGDILAATFEPTRGNLWILSTNPGAGPPNKVRLLSVQVETGASEVHLIAPRRGLFDSHWLVADQDGRLLLVASSRLAKRHVVLQLDAGEKLNLRGILRGKGALAFAPAVDPNGYSFPLRSGNHLSGITRTPTLSTQPGKWFDLLECL
jgi:hypothetical protein